MWKPVLLFALCVAEVSGFRQPMLMQAQTSDSSSPARRNFLKVAGAGAGLAVVKKLSAGGSYTDTPNLDGKVVVVTGANTGLGKQNCVRLANMGAEVIVASRDFARCQKAAEDIQGLTGSKKISARELDLANLGSIEQFAQDFSKSYGSLDILVNNAGVMAIPERETTKNGFEKQIGINHFGHFHLTNLLMPQIKAAADKTGDARIINLSSDAHFGALNGMNFDDIMSEKNYDPWLAYCQSKLANILFTKELQSKIGASSGISVGAVHPGVVRTDLGRSYFIPKDMCTQLGTVDCKGQLPQPVMGLLAATLPVALLTTKSPEEGAMTQVKCSADPKLKAALSGKYFRDCGVAEPSGPAKDMEAAARLWKLSEEVTGRSFNV